ncbi:MAG: DUF5777 family beta-barrel protein [Bacteroidota bacterium]|nr:DUF5777 family beta-barrel protein [Bacteroidota bacterium]
MKKIYTYIVAFLIVGNIQAQDDMLALLNDSNEKADPVSGMFKGNRLVNGHTTETVAKQHLDYKIHHRFGRVNEGPYQFFGIDNAQMFMGFDYGVTDKLTMGIGRSNENKTFTGLLKYKIMTQTGKGRNSKSISMTWLSNMGYFTKKWSELGLDARKNFATSRMSFTHQLLVARKFSSKMSLQLMPTFFHQNLVIAADEPNDLYIMGVGGSFRINRSTRFNVEYYPVLNRYKNSTTTNPLSIGFDIETGGHVFQLVLSNSRGMVENIFLPSTAGKWTKGDLYFGFNILRYFKLGKRR